MKFSGHETFTIREGWLYKGMELVQNNPTLFKDNIPCADALGVGTNMAKSIKHWLQVTGLTESIATKPGELRFTDFGRLIWKYDPYFTDQGTWWLLHIHLVRNQSQATTWYWFFNLFAQQRFDRATCNARLQSYISLHQKRAPSINTLTRDANCLLASYARNVPETMTDPEDYTECPLVELDLATHFRLTGTYELNFARKNIPAEIFAYCLAMEFGSKGKSGVTVQEAASSVRGPGRVFLLNNETLYDTIAYLESQDDKILELAGLGGERTVKYDEVVLNEWIERYFKKRASNAAA
jgi:hypothetical protein